MRLIKDRPMTAAERKRRSRALQKAREAAANPSAEPAVKKKRRKKVAPKPAPRQRKAAAPPPPPPPAPVDEVPVLSKEPRLDRRERNKMFWRRIGQGDKVRP